MRTYESLLLALVFNLDDGSSTLVNKRERPVLHVLLDIRFGHSATDEPFCVEDGVSGVGVERILGCLSNSEKMRRES